MGGCPKFYFFTSFSMRSLFGHANIPHAKTCQRKNKLFRVDSHFYDCCFTGTTTRILTLFCKSNTTAEVFSVLVQQPIIRIYEHKIYSGLCLLKNEPMRPWKRLTVSLQSGLNFEVFGKQETCPAIGS